MNATDLCYTPAVELRDAIRSRELSARELVESVLDRLERVDAQLNAVVARRPESALAEAERESAHPSDGALAGIPVTVKDLNETLDMPTTYGSAVFRDNVAEVEALVVTRMRAAGAIVIGKTNTPEYGLRPTTENSVYGATHNPWDLDRTPGGSSGGAAAAVAAGISPLAQAADGGGSCRVPASCCGVVGIKPTRGRVPWAPTAYEYWLGLATNGPIARTVRDAALLLDVLSGPVVGEPYGVPNPERPFLEACAEPPPRRKLGFFCATPDGDVDPQVRDALLDAVATFESLGHDVVEIDSGLGALDARRWLACAEANTASVIADVVPGERLPELEASTLAMAQRGWQIGAADYCSSASYVRQAAAELLRRWAGYDALLMPTLPSLPPRQGTLPSSEDYDVRWREYLHFLAFTSPFNVTGQPAISVPSGWSAEGMPVGLQIACRPGEEAAMLQLAASFEEARPWLDRRPEIEVGA
jgi:amidase/aspartyl-tRNA(Asn)/glutamyl-tRNA(Gln) amidotransferase subunit A